MIRNRRLDLRELPVERCCQLLSVSRSEYYAKVELEHAGPDELLAAVQELADKKSAYGYRRIAAHLRKKGRHRATDRRVRRRMRQLGLNRRRKRRKARTTVPGKGPASPNLAAELVLTGPRQLLVTDLSYVAVGSGFGYVSVMLDAFSRRALGWAASESLATELPLEALHMAIANGNLPQGWVHHSDRGCQYTSEEYQRQVVQNHGLLSNSKPACPYDNAKMESFFKTYKYEEANFQTFDSIGDLTLNLATFLEDYNKERLHSSIGYRSPLEFEAFHAKMNEQMCVR
jgi:putative transposase